MTVAICMLAYGALADQCDEYVKMGESISIKSMKRFCKNIITLYGEQYIRSPNEQGISRLLQEGNERGFPGSHNDLNILDHPLVFDNMIHGDMPQVNYEVNGHRYTLVYYLSDGIYPKWATLMQTIAHPTNEKKRLFARKEEVVRKDVERAFGVLKIRRGITKGPARYWKKDNLCIIMKSCILLHNMIIEDERDADVEDWRPLPDVRISHPEYIRDPVVRMATISSRLEKICRRGTHTMLRLDLMDHLWNKFGDEVI